MRIKLLSALIALNLALAYCAPQNNAEVSVTNDEKAEDEIADVVGAADKGDKGLLDGYQNDDSMVYTCDGHECKLMRVGQAKAMAATTAIKSVRPTKGNSQMTTQLEQAMSLAAQQIKSLNDQKMMLANLQKGLTTMNTGISKGQSLMESAKGQYASTMTKGLSFAPSTTKGSMFAAPSTTKGGMFAAPASKGFMAPPSKGGNAAANMQMEAALCPMTMFELGKCQKLQTETKQQLDNAHAMNALLMSEKSKLQSELAASEVLRQKSAAAAAYNAQKYAEEKRKAEALAAARARAESEKAMLNMQKNQLEQQLSASQSALTEQRMQNMQLSDALKKCNDDKDALTQANADLERTLQATQAQLLNTQRDLQVEQYAHSKTKRELEATQEELEATEAARRQLEEAKQQLEDELQETKNQLDTVSAERDQLQVTLDATDAALNQCNEQKLQCQAELAQEKAITQQLSSQLADAMTMLQAERKAREALAETIMMVKAAAEKVQEEVKKLQLENVQLRAQLEKLRSEQETALAMAAGCPPTYEKFGISCYKYVREKTPWKMAQEQCMKDSGNLVSIESRMEQIYLVDFLKRYGGSNADAYAFTSGNKLTSSWKWLGSNQQYVGQSGQEYWYNALTKMKPGYDCMAMYLYDSANFGKWAGLPCYNAAAFICEYSLAPPGTTPPPNAAEAMAMMEMSREAPYYLSPLMGTKDARYDDKYVHLGAYDYSANGVFKWLSTKNPVDLGDTSWLPQNPRGKGRRCLAFSVWDMNQFGDWADEYCWVDLPFICEIETL